MSTLIFRLFEGDRMSEVIEIPVPYLWLSVGFAALVAGSCLVMGYALGKDLYRPLRDVRGRFVKKD
jgi:hypothetical protein